jgi:Zn-dependent metalloprotease
MIHSTHNNAGAYVTCRCCAFLPPYIIRRLGDSDVPELRRIAFDTHGVDTATRATREFAPSKMMGRHAMPGVGYRRKVYDMEGADRPLPGVLRRSENGPVSDDPVVNEAFDASGITYRFYKTVLGRESLDGAGYPLVSSVHYGVNVANAFWNGVQMVYGATDGHYFLPFTRSLAIAAHEMTHGVVNFTSQLAYADETGALNESFCDVMGLAVEHWHHKLSIDDDHWMIGNEIAGPGLGKVAGFRSFTAEKAYADHPVLGTDPQPKHFNDYVTCTEDHGGVHLNSGIANHAFYLAARALGGNLWDRAVPIWYQAFTQGMNPQATFVDAATDTSLAAKRLFGDAAAHDVAEAWKAVGVRSEV